MGIFVNKSTIRLMSVRLSILTILKLSIVKDPRVDRYSVGKRHSNIFVALSLLEKFSFNKEYRLSIIV